MSRASFRSLNIDAWPPLDRALWSAARYRESELDDTGPAAAWSLATVIRCERSYGVWLNWLNGKGWLEMTDCPVGRISADRLRLFIAEYGVGRAPLTVAGTVRDIAMVLRAGSPPEGAAWLTRLGWRMVNSARPSRPKLPRMANLVALLDLADRMMAKGWNGLRRSRRSGAVEYRDGLLIAFLAHRPLRVRNLSTLAIDESIVFEGHRVRLNIPGVATKKGVPIANALPDELGAAVRHYIDEVRPCLLDPAKADPGWLWLGRRGRRLPEEQIATRVRKTCMLHLGKDMSPHLFRDCAVTTIAIYAPHQIGIAKDVLTHATAAASERCYNQAGSFAAATAHANLIERLRDQAEN